MFFRNLAILRLDPNSYPMVSALDAALDAARFHPVATTQKETMGWVDPVTGEPDGYLVHSVNGFLVVCLQRQCRQLPPAVIREYLAERVASIEARENRQLGRRERLRLKEEVTFELLAQAFVRTSRTYAYFDPFQNALVIDAGQWKHADELTELLRGCLGSLRVHPLQPAESPQAAMTRWLRDDSTPDATLQMGEQALFEDPRTEGAEVRVKRQDMLSSEIKGHIEAGKRVRRLALTWNDRVAFTLDADMSIKSVKFLDLVREASGDREPESAAERFDADLAIMTLEIGQLIPALLGWFGGEAKREAA